MIFEEIVIFKLLICNFEVILTDFECSKNKFLLPENKKRDKFYSFHPKTIKEEIPQKVIFFNFGKVIFEFQVLTRGLSYFTKYLLCNEWRTTIETDSCLTTKLMSVIVWILRVLTDGRHPSKPMVT